MYICTDCRQTFDSPNCVLDSYSEYWGAIAHHYKSVCPHCGSDDFEEMDKCEICGEWIDPGAELCDNCRDLIKSIANDIRAKARYTTDRFNLKYGEFINHLVTELDNGEVDK